MKLKEKKAIAVMKFSPVNYTNIASRRNAEANEGGIGYTLIVPGKTQMR